MKRYTTIGLKSGKTISFSEDGELPEETNLAKWFSEIKTEDLLSKTNKLILYKDGGTEVLATVLYCEIAYVVVE